MDQIPPTNQNPTQSLSLPEAWPGAFGLFKYSAAVVRQNLSTLVILFILSFLSGVIIGIITSLLRLPSGIDRLLSYLVGFLFTAATTVALLKSSSGSKISTGDSIKEAVSVYVNMVIALVATFILTAISLVALVIPFFFVFPRLLLAPYFVVDQKMAGIDAVKASWNATKGHLGKIWGVLLVTVLFGILCIVLIGIYFSIMYSAATVLLYHYLTRHNSIATAADVPPTPIAPASPRPPVINPTPPTL